MRPFVKFRCFLKSNPSVSARFQEKRRNKNFMMMRHNRDVRGKTKRSFRDKQVVSLVCACTVLKNKLVNARERNEHEVFCACVASVR